MYIYKKLPEFNKCKIAVIGLGYVDFLSLLNLQNPQYVKDKEYKNKVIGFDLNEQRLKELNEVLIKLKKF